MKITSITVNTPAKYAVIYTRGEGQISCQHVTITTQDGGFWNTSITEGKGSVQPYAIKNILLAVRKHGEELVMNAMNEHGIYPPLMDSEDAVLVDDFAVDSVNA